MAHLEVIAYDMLFLVGFSIIFMALKVYYFIVDNSDFSTKMYCAGMGCQYYYVKRSLESNERANLISS